MSRRTVQFSFFEVTWVIIGFLLIAIFFLLQQIRETPPYIVLSETEEAYRFESGSFELSPEYMAALEREVVPRISEMAHSYKCDVIQVIGHTDGVGMKYRSSNLDESVMPHLHGIGQDEEPLPGSNIDLGMLRAIAVARFLESRLAEVEEIRHVLPYSAGPIIGTDGGIRKETGPFDDRDARRVELRLTVSGDPVAGRS